MKPPQSSSTKLCGFFYKLHRWSVELIWRAQKLVQTTLHTKPLRLGESAPLFVCMVTVLPNTSQTQQLYQWERSRLPRKENPPSGVSGLRKGVIIIPEKCNVNLCLLFSRVVARSRRLLLFAHSFFLFFFFFLFLSFLSASNLSSY